MPLSVYAHDVGISYRTAFRWFKSRKIQGRHSDIGTIEMTEPVGVIIHQREQPASFEEELAKDMLEIVTVFSARLYGSRSHKFKQWVEKLRQAAESL
jgi:predicted site-specific integrase-resolvase